MTEKLVEAPQGESAAPDGDALLLMAIAEGADLGGELYSRYRRPLLQVFLQRRVDRDAAQELLQLTFLQAIRKIRLQGLEDPTNLGGFLYRTATRLAQAYWRGEIVSDEPEGDALELGALRDEALCLEERIDPGILSKCVRELMRHLSAARDREVLRRFYLNEESQQDICASLELSELQFNQVLWRARQRFGEILRRHGLGTGTRPPMLVVALALALLATTEGKLLTPDEGDLAVELHSALSFTPTASR
jgi:RNA polymerase sigma-70 factor (ECF subfamily)